MGGWGLAFMVRRREDIVFPGGCPEPGVDGFDMAIGSDSP